MIPDQIGSIAKTPETEGIIFDIQRYSIHDGPGIRTLIFLKGCPLQCVWCSNPEGVSILPDLMWVEQKCIHCKKCLMLCSQKALSVNADGHVVVDRRQCKKCGRCATNCYAEALKLVGRYVNVEEVIDFVEKDKAYYEQSGGGITLGGGDPLAQPEFAKKLLKECKNRGLNTAVETSAYVPWATIVGLLDYVDLFLIDVKTIDTQIHHKNTRVPNGLILENIRKLDEHGARLLIRVPVVPGYNDSDENIKLTIEFAMSLKSQPEVTLLPYFELGIAKYKQLGREYPLEGVRPPSAEEIERLREFTVLNKGF